MPKKTVYEIFFEHDKFIVSETLDQESGEWSSTWDVLIGNTATFEETKNNKESIKIFFKPRENLYLVNGIYSTGDSLGTAEGRSEVLDIFQTKEEAEFFVEKVEAYNELTDSFNWKLSPQKKEEKAKKILERLGNYVKQGSDSEGEYLYFSHHGKKFTFPWGGFFEQLSYLSITKLEYDKI